MSSLARGMTQRRHQMALAQAGAGDEHNIGVLFDKVQMKEVLDEQAVDLGRPVPVKLIKRLQDREHGLLDTAGNPAVITGGGLAACQLREVLQVRPVLIDGG